MTHRALPSCWLRVTALAAAGLLLGACQAPLKRQQAELPPPPDMTMSASAAVPAHREPAASQASVNFLLAQDEKDPRLSALAVAGGTIWVLPKPFLTHTDLHAVQARRWDARGQAFVRFGFTPGAAEKLADMSRRYPGKIIVVTVGQHIVGLIRFNAALDKGVLDMPTGSEEQAIQIADAVGSKIGR